MMFWYGTTGGAFWLGVLMWAFVIVFWGLLIWVIYTLITRFARKPGDGQAGDGARRILDERLARGELGTDEYRHLRDAMADDGRSEARANSG